MPDPSEILEISARKVAHVIACSRDSGAKAAPWDEDDGSEAAATEVDAEVALDNLTGDAARPRLREFLDSLNEDEQANLIALAWIGRGTYAPDELDEAISAARAEHGANASAYLFSLPLLPDYLEDALEQMGMSLADAGGRTSPSSRE